MNLRPSSTFISRSILQRRKTMKRNMGIVDRVIRIALAALVAVLYFANQLSLTAAVILGILAVIFLATGIVGFCPLYLPFGLSSKRKSAA
jgi:fatty acid desaturase